MVYAIDLIVLNLELTGTTTPLRNGTAEVVLTG